MATLRQIRRRIRSIQGLQRVTKAMQMMSVARLRKAQDAVTQARPYATELQRMIGTLLRGIGDYEHPLLQRREPNRRLVIVVAGDRGLCGAFNSNVLRAAQERIAGHGEGTALICAGTRAADYFTRRKAPVVKEMRGLFNRLEHYHAVEIAQFITQAYVAAEYDHIEIVYNEFASMLHQIPRALTLLPIPLDAEGGGSSAAPETLYEPTRESVLDALIPQQVMTQIWRVLLESQAAEHAARMNAMENATKNAKELVGELTLERNRVRQTMITKEIAEIVGGAEAMKSS